MKQKEVKELSIDELSEKLLSFQKELSDLKWPTPFHLLKILCK